MRQILPICNRRRRDYIGVTAHRLDYGLVQGSVGVCESDGRREKSVRTVRWVRRLGTVRVHVLEKWLVGECNGDIWIQGSQRLSPKLPARGRELYLNACDKKALTKV